MNSNSQISKGKGYFIEDLLSQLVFREANLFDYNPSLQRRQSLLQGVCYGLVCLFFIASLLYFSVAYMTNRQYVRELSSQVTQIEDHLQKKVSLINANRLSLSDRVIILNQVKAFLLLASERKQKLQFGWGLSQQEKIATRIEALYRRLLSQLLLPDVVSSLETALLSDDQPILASYQGLQAYLMLTGNDYFNADVLQAYAQRHSLAEKLYAPITDEWQQQRQFDTLPQHLSALLEHPVAEVSKTTNGLLVERVRTRLQAYSMSEWMYQSIKADILLENAQNTMLPEFTLSEAGGVDVTKVFAIGEQAQLGAGFSGIFTQDGRQYFYLELHRRIERRLEERALVMGEKNAFNTVAVNETQVERLRRDVTAAYEAEYLSLYQGFADSIRVAPFASASLASGILSILADFEHSPLLQVIKAVRHETLKQQQKMDVRHTLANNKEYDVADYFLPLHRLVDDQGVHSAVLHSTMELLGDVQSYLSTAAYFEEYGSGLSVDLIQQGRALEIRLTEAASQPIPLLQNFLMSLTKALSLFIRKGDLVAVNRLWYEGPYQFCREAIVGRFPVALNSKKDIFRQSFIEFFGVEGRMDRFFNQHLKASVDRSRTPWRVRPHVANPLKLSAAGLKVFEQAEHIRQAMFSFNTGELMLEFDIQPVRMGQRLFKSELQIGGQNLMYQNDVRLRKTIQWPGSANQFQIGITLTTDDSATLTQQFSGQWALFRFLRNPNTRLYRAIDQGFELAYRLQDHTIWYKIIETNTRTSLRQSPLHAFSCPERL